MRRFTMLMAAVAAVGLALAACGGETSGSSPDVAASQPGDDSTDMDMSGVGEPADAAGADRTIEVTTLDTMAYDPASISVAPGETITFSVTNVGDAAHEFTLGDQAMQDEHAEEMADMGSGMGHDEPNSISLQPGETKELTWRFGEAGTVIYACHEPGHYQAGMRGEITVG
ncbi:MAG: plastocyanin/azurin family copper-binding protein [Actinomycetes bacterium]